MSPDPVTTSPSPSPSPSPPSQRSLGPVHTTLVTVGAMVGSGIFATPSDVARRAGTPARSMAVWVAGGVVSLLGVLSIAEPGAALPATGGLYVFLRRAYGPLVAFLFGWAMLVVLGPSSVGFYASVTAAHVSPALGVSPALVAVVLIALVAVVNMVGVRSTAALQSATTVARTTGLAVAALAALGAHAPGVRESLGTSVPGWTSAAAALVPALWAYDGWIDLTSVAGEVRDPGRVIPRALVLGTLAVTAVYLLAVAGYQHALGFRAVADSTALGTDLGFRLAGEPGRRALAALVALSTFGGCVIGMFTTTRVIQAMGLDGTFVRGLGALGRMGTPSRAIGVTAVLAVGYVLSPRLGRLAEVFVVGAWPFYTLGALATVVLRHREPALPRPFRTPWYPWPIVGFVLGSVGLLASYAVASPGPLARSLGTVALGVPVYYGYRGWRRREGSR